MPDIPHVHICEDCEEEFECLNINCEVDSKAQGYVCEDCMSEFEDDDYDNYDDDMYDDSVD